MHLLCLLGFHVWSGCACTRCAADRHQWNGCKCENSGCTATRHDESRCICSRCGADITFPYGLLHKLHDWDGCRCRVCSKVKHKGQDNLCSSCKQLNLQKVANDAGKMLFEVIGFANIARFALDNPTGIILERAIDREDVLNRMWRLRHEVVTQLPEQDHSQFVHEVGAECVSEFNLGLMLSAKLAGRSQWDKPHFWAPHIIGRLTPLIEILFQGDQVSPAVDPPQTWINRVEQGIDALPKTRIWS